jgi:Protein of Unknown function (DUF2784)
MVFRLLTDAVVILHFAFLAFVVGGGFLARRYRWLMVPHLVAAAWGVYVEAMPGMLCPLTPLENHFARLAGTAGYEGGFIEHYLVPIIYPDGLTARAQLGLAMALIAVNVIAYTWPRRTDSVRSGSRAA